MTPQEYQQIMSCTNELLDITETYFMEQQNPDPLIMQASVSAVAFLLGIKHYERIQKTDNPLSISRNDYLEFCK